MDRRWGAFWISGVGTASCWKKCGGKLGRRYWVWICVRRSVAWGSSRFSSWTPCGRFCREPTWPYASAWSRRRWRGRARSSDTRWRLSGSGKSRTFVTDFGGGAGVWWSWNGPQLDIPRLLTRPAGVPGDEARLTAPPYLYTAAHISKPSASWIMRNHLERPLIRENSA